VPAAVADLGRFMERLDLPALAAIAISHAHFESIHPFIDGNGRTGRALIHAQLRWHGLATRTIMPISAGLLGSNERYFAALSSYQAGHPAAIVTLVAEVVFPALDNARQLTTEVGAARDRWLEDLRARRGSAAWRLTDLIAGHPVVNAGFVGRRLGVTEANAVNAIGRLVEAGALARIGTSRRNRLWEAPDVLAAMDRFAERARQR
jgi:Fic family protein